MSAKPKSRRIKDHCGHDDNTNPPPHFFPGSTLRMKAYFWHCLMVEKLDPHQAVHRYIWLMANSQIEQEFMTLLVKGVEENLNNFLVTDVIRTAV